MHFSLTPVSRRATLTLASLCMLLLGMLITPPRHASASTSASDYITRAEVLARAKNWYGRSLTYNSSRSSSSLVSDVDGLHKYGPDCSGMVSMAWHVNPGSSGGYNTSTLPNHSTQISRSSLRPGDLLDNTTDGHAILFEAWASDGVHFSYYSFGSTPMLHYDGGSGSTEGPLGSFTSGTRLAGWPEEHYVAYSYPNIVDGVPGKLADVNGDGYPELIGMDISGNLYVYPHNATTTIGTSMWASRILVGTSWNMYDTILLGDVNDDGRPDILGRDSSGNLYGYAHNATTTIGTSMWASRTLVGTSWNMYEQIALADVGKNNSRTTGNGAELIGLDSAGNLYAYPNNDFATLDTSTFSSRILIGTGWDMYSTFLTGDIDRDGYTDLLGLDANGGLYAYRNNQTSTVGTDWASRIQVGSGWDMYILVD